MPIYSISYDLNTPGQKYQQLENKLKSICTKTVKYVETSWLVKYSGNANDLSTQIHSILDDNDSWVVIKVVGDYSGWLTKSLWNKIKELFE